MHQSTWLISDRYIGTFEDTGKHRVEAGHRFRQVTRLRLINPSQLDSEGDSELGKFPHVSEGEFGMIDRIVGSVDVVVRVFKGALNTAC